MAWRESGSGKRNNERHGVCVVTRSAVDTQVQTHRRVETLTRSGRARPRCASYEIAPNESTSEFLARLGLAHA